MTEEKHVDEGLEDVPVTPDAPFGDEPEPDPQADDPDEDVEPEKEPD